MMMFFISLVVANLAVTFAFGGGDTEKERLTVDGRPFTINQKDFKPAKFTMYGHEFDDTYGFVSTDFLPLDNRGYTEVMEKCDLEANTMPLYQYSKYGTLNYYPDTQAYDNWKGYDLVPENQHNYVAGGDYALNMNFKDGKRLLYDKTITMQTCRIPQEDGGAWHLQRVGPIVSTGGYDWWQLGFPDAGLLAEVLQKHPEGVDVNKFIFVPVFKNGTRIGYPPVHTHHVHVTTQNGVRPRLKMRPMCVHKLGLGIELLDKLVAETLCYNSSMYFEQHGDYICRPEDDGLDCLTQGDKNPRRISEPIDLEGELNDVRPRGSEPLEWYYQFAVRWSPVDVTRDPVSQAVLLGPGLIVPPSQLSKAFTYLAPTHAQNVMMMTSKMLWSGQLVRLKAHSHSSVLDGVMMLRGLPVDFGLGDAKFIPPLPATALITTELGFRDNEDLAQHILFHMKKSQEAYDRDCGVNKKNLRNSVCLRPRPDWMFGAVSDEATALFAGVEYSFDRRPKMFCMPWAFEVGEEYTAVQFNRRITQPPAPAYPGTIPASIRQHLSFILSYDHTGLKVSQGDLVVVGHDGPFYDFHQKLSPPMFLARLAAVVLWSGPPLFASTLYELEWMFVAIFTAIAASLAYFVIWCMRKSPAIDKIFTNMHAQVTMLFNSVAKAAQGVGKPEHKYEMVSLTEEDHGAELQAESVL